MSLNPETSAALGQLLQGLMATENSVRLAAEKLLEQQWRTSENVPVLLLFLADLAVNGADDVTRAFAAVLFRRTAIRTPQGQASITDRTVGMLDPAVKQQLRAILLQGFVSPQSPSVRRKLADAVLELAKDAGSSAAAWPELVPAVLHAAGVADAPVRESAFRILSSAPEIVEKSMVQQILPVFTSGFADSSDEVRIAACTAFVAFFRELPKLIWQLMAPLLPHLLNSLPMFLQSGHTDALAEVLQALIDLVELAPKMFRQMFPTMIEFCLTISKDSDIDSNTRLAALELLTTFAEVSPSMCKATPGYTEQMVLITLRMLTEVSLDDEDAAEWNNDDNSEEYEDEPEYDAARQLLDRVALKLGGHALAQPLFQYLPGMAQLNSWREVFAALMALSSAAEGCCDVLATEIPKLLDMVMPALEHPHARVQYACCNALGQMLTDFADVIQRTAGDRILPALVLKLTNKSVPRVQAHAAAALVNFCEAATKEVLEPYLDDLLNNLLGLLQSPKRYVQEQVLTTIAIIADAAEKKFIKYHSTLLPMLMGFLKADLGPENRMLTAKCIECATLIAVAVGRDNFSAHSQELIGIMGELQNTCTEPDDPVKLFLEQGWGRLCRIIGEEFVPFLPLVLPPLMEAAKAAQDISLLEEDEAEEFNSNEEWDVISLSGKLIAVHTAALDEKAAAMDLLRIYASQLRGHFFPYVTEIVQEIALPALDFYLHDGVRGSAALALAALLKSAIYATSNNSVETLTLWAQICLKLVDALTNDPVPELLVAYYTALTECLDALAPALLSTEQMLAVADAIKTNLTEIYGRIKQRESEDDEYQEDVADIDEDYTDEELLDEINKAISAVLRNAKATFLPEFQQSLAALTSTFVSDENSHIKLCGLCTVCELLEHVGPDFDQVDYIRYIAVECLPASQASIRQAAAYAVGVAAQYGGSSYTQVCVETLPSLFKIATFPDARAEENINATENCIAAIPKICANFSASVPDMDKVLQDWVLLLPIVQDDEAATYAYNFLADLIQNQHPAVMSQTHKVVEAVLEAISHRSISGAVAEKISPGARALLASLPLEKAMTLVQKYSSSSEVAKYF
ncbi:hypothetical protein HF325_000569 [Metschnikowia pulcherrima]|uniref:Importin N-terminal domain-containing protein n=1 Tax=Metschnikowia pulcherrima TaxID=27326 RepID=A0A8H7LHI8_9ASCO|nr:hypothetical protein HF325_000569 [Metschnikowia pulcherrima]